MKIRLYPTETQRQTLLKWFGTARWTYNQCLDSAKGGVLDQQTLRAQHINNKNFKEQNKWALDTPYDIRDEGMKDLLKGFNSNFAKKDPGRFEMKPRRRKTQQESIVIHSKHWKNGVFYPKFFGKDPIRAAEPLPPTLSYDSRLIRTHLNEYYLCLPQPLAIQPENQRLKWRCSEEDRIISIDPGVRTFATGYDPQGLAIEWGKADISRIYRLSRAYDKLQSKWNDKQRTHKSRYQMKRAGRRIQKKIRNLVDDAHKKHIKWLCEQYDCILLPEFNTQRMVRRGQRKIRSKTAKAMLTWSHYRFRQRLISKVREYPWVKLIICDEHYTTKTCGNCGTLHHKLGGAKTFVCPTCAVVLDRDANAARNILLRFITLHRAGSHLR
jgi:putative transposase